MYSMVIWNNKFPSEGYKLELVLQTLKEIIVFCKKSFTNSLVNLTFGSGKKSSETNFLLCKLSEIKVTLLFQNTHYDLLQIT